MVIRTLIALAGLLAAVIPVAALESIPARDRTAVGEYALKAAYLFNFTKFVEWPVQEPSRPAEVFTIGVIGRDPFGADIAAQLSTKTVQDKKLVFTQLSHSRQAADCQMVFISASETRGLGEILGSLQNSPVLTVSDMDAFVQRGGMVGFTREQNKVRFQINLAAADKAGLKISSQLLKLAKSIEGKPQAGGD
jgi:hypothetical protein